LPLSQTAVLRRLLTTGFIAVLWAAPAHATMPFSSGGIPPEVARAFADGAMNVPAHHALSTSVAQTTWRVPILMVAFSDEALSYTPQDFEYALFDTTHSTSGGSVFDYYRWASGGRLTVQGNVVATVVLPHDKYYYGYNAWGLSTVTTPNNIFGAIRDALLQNQAQHPGQIRWSDYDLDHDGYVDMLWVIHAGVGGETNLDRDQWWSITSRMSSGWRFGEPFLTDEYVPGSTSQYMRVDRFSSLPELSGLLPGRRSEIGVYCHEFGHALGLPDLYDTSAFTSGTTNSGPGNWSLMSTGGYGANGVTPETPAGLDAWSRLFLGWVGSVRPSDDTSMLLGPAENGAPVVDMWFQGEPNAEHFLIENRRRVAFDRYIPAEGLLVFHVDDAQIGSLLPSNRINAGLTPGLTLLEGDGDNDLMLGRNRGDANDPLPGGTNRTLVDDDTSPWMRTFAGAVTNLAIRDIASVGSDSKFTAQVRAPGWAAPEDHTDPAFQPVFSSGPAATAAADANGTLYEALTETRGTGTQILLHSRGPGGWGTPLQISHSTRSASEPTLIALPGNDLAVAWRDTRSGKSQIYYRSRIHGTWTDEQVIVDPPVSSYRPALGTDGHGMIYLTWINLVVDRGQVMFMRFAYSSPFGIQFAVSAPTADPDSPALAVDRDGRAYVLWADRATVPQSLSFARFSPDSGLSAPLRLAPQTQLAQTAVSAVVDSHHVLHSAWLISAPGINQLHYQRRDFQVFTWLRDTLLETQGSNLLNPELTIDPQNGIHVVFESGVSGVQQIRYRRWTTAHGWDVRSTEVSASSDGNASNPRIIALSPGNVSVLYARYDGLAPHFMTRDRRLDSAPPTAVTPPLTGVVRIALGPNPLRAGHGLDAWWSGPPDAIAPPLELFDIAGRRVAALEFAASGTVRRAHLDAGATRDWASGVYFARVRGERAAASRVVVLR